MTNATDYANRGACAKAAKRDLTAQGVTDPKRGVDFEMTVSEAGRWTWKAITQDVVVDETTKVATPVTRGAERTREDWLRELVYRLHDEVFSLVGNANVGAKPPAFRISCSFPGGGTARKCIGECWSAANSDDGTTEMMVSPILDDEMRVAGIVAHEMVHMYVGVEHGHKAPFKDLATAIGLEGKMTATTEGEQFIAQVQPILADMGAYPHAALSLAGRKKKQTYLLKAECPSCGCTIRITQTWVAAAGGELRCPDPSCEDEDGNPSMMDLG